MLSWSCGLQLPLEYGVAQVERGTHRGLSAPTLARPGRPELLLGLPHSPSYPLLGGGALQGALWRVTIYERGLSTSTHSCSCSIRCLLRWVCRRRWCGWCGALTPPLGVLVLLLLLATLLLSTTSLPQQLGHHLPSSLVRLRVHVVVQHVSSTGMAALYRGINCFSSSWPPGKICSWVVFFDPGRSALLQPRWERGWLKLLLHPAPGLQLRV